MGRPLYTNNAFSALAQGITSTQTTIQIDSGTGVLFPSPTGSDYFYATITSITNPNSYEIIQVTNNTNNVFTCVRGAEGTIPQYFNISDNIELRITAAGLNSFAGPSTVTASAVTYTPSGDLTSTNVQGAIDQMEAQILSGGGVAASAVSYIPSGTLTANNVQAAIDQLEVQVNTGGVTIKEEYQTATANQTVFTLATFTYSLGTNGLSVYVNGSKQVRTLNYTETNTSTVTFANGLNAGDVVEFVFI